MIRTLVLLSIALMLNACKRESTTGQVDNMYSEKHRPQVHFTPKEKWMNDPNGMVYYQGEYHLFYQYYPDGDVWGPMHWGHAITTDLVHWEHLPIALYPDSLGMIFSGSAVVDEKNSSGFGTVDNPPLVAIFTYHDDKMEKQGRNDFQTQGIAYSIDKGRTWKKYEHNPVVHNPGVRDFRDPKVFWHDASKKWVMILVAADHAELYGSADLKSWSKLSDFGKTYGNHGGVWECPDLFPLTVEGETTQKWVMIININPGAPNGGSGTQYFIGEFDGEKFVCDTDPAKTSWLDYGPDNYAGITWSNAPDGRKIFMGWMNNWNYAQVVPTSPWRGATTTPRDLLLVRIGEVLHVKSSLSKEFQKLVEDKKSFSTLVVTDSIDVSKGLNFPISTSLIEGAIDAKDFAIEFSNKKGQRLIVGYEATTKRYFIDRMNSGNTIFSKDFTGLAYAPRIVQSDKVKFAVVLDVSSIEIFFDDGVTMMTSLFFPDEVFTQLKVRRISENVTMEKLEIKQLSSVW